MRSCSGVVYTTGIVDAKSDGLLRRHVPVLARKRVWLFSVGSFGDRHPIVGGLMRKEPREISELEHTLHPRDDRVFAGVIDLDHWPAWGRLLFKAPGGHPEDNRHWPDIDVGRPNRPRVDCKHDQPIVRQGDEFPPLTPPTRGVRLHQRQDLPGQTLFQYVDESGAVLAVSSASLPRSASIQ